MNVEDPGHLQTEVSRHRGCRAGAKPAEVNCFLSILELFFFVFKGTICYFSCQSQNTLKTKLNSATLKEQIKRYSSRKCSIYAFLICFRVLHGFISCLTDNVHEKCQTPFFIMPIISS